MISERNLFQNIDMSMECEIKFGNENSVRIQDIRTINVHTKSGANTCYIFFL